MSEYIIDIWDEWGNSCFTKDCDSFVEALRHGMAVMKADYDVKFLGFFISKASDGSVMFRQYNGWLRGGSSKNCSFDHYDYGEVSRFELMEI